MEGGLESSNFNSLPEVLCEQVDFLHRKCESPGVRFEQPDHMEFSLPGETRATLTTEA